MAGTLPEVNTVFRMLDMHETFPTPAKNALLAAATAYVEACDAAKAAKGARVQGGNSQGGNSQGGNLTPVQQAYRDAVDASKAEIALRTECRKKAAPIAQKSKGTYGWVTKCAQTRVIFSRG
jgi:hypothetical protein